MKPKTYATFREAALSNTIINRYVSGDCTNEQCMTELANEINRLASIVIELERVSSKKFKMPDGRVLVYHCPDESIPFSIP